MVKSFCLYVYNECVFSRTCVCPVKKEVASPLRLFVCLPLLGLFWGKGLGDELKIFDDSSLLSSTFVIASNDLALNKSL